MSNAACKAEWCDSVAKSMLFSGEETLTNINDADPELRIKIAEVYVDAIKSANEQINKILSQ